jgi:periplasmic protein TonB
MRGSVLGSGMAHVMLLVALFLVRQPMNIVVPGPEVVQVSLLDPSEMVAPAPAPPIEPPVEKPAEIKPVEETGVKLEPERPKPKPKKETHAPAPKPASAPALPSARVGQPGLSADVAVNAEGFEFTYYLVLIRDRISANWTPPAGISTGGKPVRAEVYFEVGRGGELSNVRIQTASGIEFFDRSALRAVTISDPMPPLPLGFSGGRLGIIYGFTWEAP